MAFRFTARSKAWRAGAGALVLAVLFAVLAGPAFLTPNAGPAVGDRSPLIAGGPQSSAAHTASTGFAFAATGLASVAAAGAAAAALLRPRQSANRSPAIVRAATAEADVQVGWTPRLSGWSPQELAAERSRALSMPEPSGYSGVRYTGPGSVNDAFIDALLKQQEQGKILPKKDLYLLVLDVIDILRKESTLQEAFIPDDGHLTVVGDIHGQYWDFMNLLKLAGRPSPQSPFLFNGDFVDRGSWSIEVISVLFAMKAKDPKHVYMNRGNHEMLETNVLYGFCGEVAAKYDVELFNLFSEAFRNLPLCHLIENKVLVMHAGLPGPDPRIWMPGQTHDPTDSITLGNNLPTLEDIKKADRYCEISPDSYAQSIGPTTSDKEIIDMRILIDMLWADPRGGDGYGPSYRKQKGVYTFGPDVSKAFCDRNGLQCIIRSHEVKADGYRWDHPQLLSVFSAPNYLDTGNNKGAYLKLTKAGDIKIEPQVFSAVPHPDVPPMKWQEVVTTSYPQLVKKMKKKAGAAFDEFGDSDFGGVYGIADLLNFDEWEPDEADHFQEVFKLDEYGRELPQK